MNTRTVLLWHNNGEERIYFTVNPARLTVTRPNENRVRSLAMGGTVNIWGGPGSAGGQADHVPPQRLLAFF